MDEFEEKLARRLRAYLAAGVASVDTAAVSRSVVRPRSNGVGRSAVAGLFAALVVALATVAVFVRLTPSIGTTTFEPSGIVEPTGSAEHPIASPAATTEASERERSDAFWIALTDFGRTSFQYGSLREITEDSHLIVLGHVTGIERGTIEPFDPALEGVGRPTVFGLVTIDEVLKGNPQTFAPDMIRVARLGWSGAENQLPTEQVILFLKNYAQMREEGGAPPADDGADAFQYARPNEYQAVLRVFDGVIEIVDGPRAWTDALRPFPAAVDGEPLEDLIDRIREFVEGT